MLLGNKYTAGPPHRVLSHPQLHKMAIMNSCHQPERRKRRMVVRVEGTVLGMRTKVRSQVPCTPLVLHSSLCVESAITVCIEIRIHMEPVYKDHPEDQGDVFLVDRSSLYIEVYQCS